MKKFHRREERAKHGKKKAIGYLSLWEGLKERRAEGGKIGARNPIKCRKYSYRRKKEQEKRKRARKEKNGQGDSVWG